MANISSLQVTEPVRQRPDSHILGHIFGIGLPALSMFPLHAGLVDHMLREQASRAYVIQTPYISRTAQTVAVLDKDSIEISLISEMARVFNELSQAQVELQPDDRRVLYEHLWDLC